MVRGARARTLAPTSSGTESRGQEGSAPHVRAGLSTADCSRLKALGMTMIKGSRSAPFGFPFAWLRASAKAGQAQGLEVVPFPECSRARAPAPRNTSAPQEVCAPINTSRLSKGGLAVCPSHSLSFGYVARCVPPTEKPRPRSPVSEYNFSCQFSVASYQFIERIWVRREAALLFCSLRVTTAVIDGGVLQF